MVKFKSAAGLTLYKGHCPVPRVGETVFLNGSCGYIVKDVVWSYWTNHEECRADPTDTNTIAVVQLAQLGGT